MQHVEIIKVQWGIYILCFFLDMCIFSVVAPDQSQNIYSESDDEFDDKGCPIGQCTALYNFEGKFKQIYTQLVGSISILLIHVIPACVSLQATAMAPFPSRRESCWACWRRITEMDGWESLEAVEKRAIYLRPMSNSACNVHIRSCDGKLKAKGENKVVADHWNSSLHLLSQPATFLVRWKWVIIEVVIKQIPAHHGRRGFL